MRKIIKEWFASYLMPAGFAAVVILMLSGYTVIREINIGARLAQDSVQESARVMASRVNAQVDSLDRFLVGLAHRYSMRQQMGQQTRSAFDDFLQQELMQYPLVHRVVVTDVAGKQLMNTASTGAGAGQLPNLADREYFKRAQAGDVGLIFEGPVEAKLDKRRSIMIARRLATPEGAFLGVVVLVVPVEGFGEDFANAALGSKGTVNLRTDTMAQVVRYPASANSGANNHDIPAVVWEMMREAPQRATHLVQETSLIDNVERIYAYQKVDEYPFWLAVGRAVEDYDIGWRTTFAVLSGVSLLFCALLLWGARQLDIHRVRMKKEISKRTQELSESESRYRHLAATNEQIIEAVPDGLLVTDLQHRILQCNQGILALTGKQRHELIGQPVEALFPEKCSGVCSSLPQSLSASASSGMGVPSVEALVSGKDGQEFPVDLRCNLLSDNGGSRIIFTLRDISDAKQAEASLLTAKLQAESANEAKSRFLSTMSHEIRTPLNAIIGMNYMLAHSDLDEAQRHQLATVDAASRQLLAQINDILDIAKIEAGQIVIEAVHFNLGTLLDDVEHLFGPLVRAKELDYAGPGNRSQLPQILVGDAYKIRQMLTNLLGNALKFTQQGQVRLEVSCLERADLHVRLRFSVRDTGIGVPEELQGRLFVPFSQVDASTTRRFGGTGLGLSLVKQLAEHMGGRVGMESQPGRGSTFWFELPLGVASVAEARAVEPKRALRVIIADDDPADCQVLLEMAKHFGWHCEAVPEGSELVRRVLALNAQGLPPDCILLDWRMPGQDGLAALTELRRQLPPSGMPSVIMITAADRDTLLRTLREASLQPDSVLTKPVNASALFNTVNDAVVHHTLAFDLVLTSSEIDTAHSRWLEGIRVLVVDDSRMNLDVCGQLLAHEGAEATTCASGEEALACLTGSPDGFDAVLMDVQMPGMDGCETTQRIRERSLQVPVIALTAGATINERERALLSGMNDFLTKPIDPIQLIRTLRRNVEAARGKTLALVARSRDGTSHPGNWPDIAGIQTDEVRHRLSGDLNLFRDLLSRFVEESAVLLEKATHALGQGKPAEAAAALHRLRGQAGNLAATVVAEEARSLEKLAGNNGLTQNALDRLLFLLNALNEAIRLELSSRSPDSVPASGTVAEGLDSEVLEILRNQLAAQDMAALDTFQALRPALQLALNNATVERLLAAINGLDFQTAAALLDELPSELASDTATPGTRPEGTQ